MIPFRTWFIISVFVASSGGCARSVTWYYKPDVRQGNYLDAALIEQVRPGMSQQQVQALLGTPLIVDPFHTQRWDYVYLFKPGNRAEVEQRHVSLYFQGDTLERIERKTDLP